MRLGFFILAMTFTLSSGMACQKNAPQGEFEKPKKVEKTIVKEEKPAAAKPTTAEEYAAALTFKAVWDAEKNNVVIKANVKEGFHAYAPGEETSIPVSLTVKPENGWVSDGTLIAPAGIKKDLGDLGISMVLEGNFELAQKLKDGKDEISGTFGCQICTNKSCDRPRQHPFKVATAAAVAK
jgi:hypothetical protein